MVTEDRIVDSHAHIIDPVRFPFIGTKGYRARADEHGTREEFCAVLIGVDEPEATRIAASNPIGFRVFDASALVYYWNIHMIDQIGLPFTALLIFGLVVLQRRLPPPQAPAPGQATPSSSCTSLLLIVPAAAAPTASKTS